MTELAFASATELTQKIKTRKISVVELLEYYLQRVDKYNSKLNAVVIDIRDKALVEAAQMDAAIARGEDLGPFGGVPMTVKEAYNLAGTPTTWGIPDWRENIPKEDAEAIKKLKSAGVNIFGKTNVAISLADFQSYNDVYGTTNNPYNHKRIPGGSSGGSAAALAAGLSGLEIGSDIGGSIRNPAHYCGVFGHKPTYNLLWTRGYSPPGNIRASSDITVIGPLARSAQDLETALRIMAGPDEIIGRGYQLNLPEWKGRTLKGLRVAVWKNEESAPVSREVQERVDLVATALSDAGSIISHTERPGFTHNSHETYQNLVHATMAKRMPDADYENLKAHVANLSPDDDSEGSKVKRAQVSSFRKWASADEQRQQLRWHWHEFFKEQDVLITPVMPTAAFTHDHRRFGKRTISVNNQERSYFEQVFWAGLTGVAYLPSTVIPTGLNDEGLPIGIQIVGQEFDDLITIGVAQQLESMGFVFTPPPNYLTRELS